MSLNWKQSLATSSCSPLIESLLRTGAPLDELCTRLVAAANHAGGHDNITCLLVRADGE